MEIENRKSKVGVETENSDQENPHKFQRVDEDEDAIMMINHLGFGNKLGEWLLGKVSEESREDKAKTR